MSAKPPLRKRPLTAEEAELWANTMRDAKQHRRKSRHAPESSEGKKTPDKEVLPKSSPFPAALVPKSDSHEKYRKHAAAPPPIASFDQRHKRKLRRNTEMIDSRLDLHGMRQKEAYPVLRSFLYDCAARGYRNVLVITGKGTRIDIERSRDYMAEERGILRRLVPQWLGEPEFRTIAISFTPAGPRHGGDGALYVRLRKLKRD